MTGARRKLLEARNRCPDGQAAARRAVERWELRVVRSGDTGTPAERGRQERQRYGREAD